jgi:enamine deaminase RidA (YjgF/YER057c/UK114 family)
VGCDEEFKKIMDNNTRLESLKLILPEAPNPVGSYVAYKKSGNLIFISGQVSFKAGGNLIKGKVGSDLTLVQAQEASQVCAINILSQIKSACAGDLNKVKNCIKLTGFVNSTDDFVDQPKVINGASELIAKVFEENGKHARAAISVNSLPLGAAVEVEAIFEIS